MKGDGSASQIAKLLASDVHDGYLKAGDMFPSERDLCSRFGVGRSIVRDGFTILQGMGLADHSKGSRPRVAKPTLSRLMLAVSEAAHFFFKDNEGRAHLDQARLFLETSMLRYSVDHASNAQIAKLISAIEQCDADLSNLNEFRLADVKFHRALAEVPGNPIFLALHETFADKMMAAAPIQKDFEEHNRISNEGHKELVAAILSKNEQGAVQALTLHLTRNCEATFRQTMAGLKE